MFERNVSLDNEIFDPKGCMKAIDRTYKGYRFDDLNLSGGDFTMFGSEDYYQLTYNTPTYTDSFFDLGKSYIKIKAKSSISTVNIKDVIREGDLLKMFSNIELCYGGTFIYLSTCTTDLFPYMCHVQTVLSENLYETSVYGDTVEFSWKLPLPDIKIPANLPIKLVIRSAKKDSVIEDGLNILDLRVCMKRLILTEAAFDTVMENSLAGCRLYDIPRITMERNRLYKVSCIQIGDIGTNYVMIGLFSKKDYLKTVDKNKLRFKELVMVTEYGTLTNPSQILSYDQIRNVIPKLSYYNWKHNFNWYTVIQVPDLSTTTHQKGSGQVTINYELEGDDIENLDDYEMLVYRNSTATMVYEGGKNVMCMV